MGSAGVSIRRTQIEVAEWADRNFGGASKRNFEDPFMGMVEELGEMAHALLKQKQGIRGTYEEHEAALRDAIGDFEVYLMDFCQLREINLEAVIWETWEKVKKRDWKKNSVTGGEGPTT